MKQLESHFTTLEQSKRLLELGVPASSADCYYVGLRSGSGYFYEILPKVCAARRFTSLLNYPCWSVGRLIEIYETCMGVPFTRYKLSALSLLDEVLERYEQNKDELDFSKLEE